MQLVIQLHRNLYRFITHNLFESRSKYKHSSKDLQADSKNREMVVIVESTAAKFFFKLWLNSFHAENHSNWNNKPISMLSTIRTVCMNPPEHQNYEKKTQLCCVNTSFKITSLNSAVSVEFPPFYQEKVFRCDQNQPIICHRLRMMSPKYSNA